MDAYSYRTTEPRTFQFTVNDTNPLKVPWRGPSVVWCGVINRYKTFFFLSARYDTHI